ncbi:MAG TPA: NAD(P)-dependent oxidoreductase [Spirochaetia bacterium]|nr:NAD(P)-dependent oxidoreductase [Spirochaetia bacterium]
MKRIAITGACGRIIQRVLPGLAERFEVTLLDLRDTTFDGERVEGVHKVDLLDNDRTKYRELFRGHDAVIHSGFVRAPHGGMAGTGDGPELFWNELDNVRMTYNVMQACVEAGVARAVVVSSNHAADYYEPLIHSGDAFGVTPDTVPYSDNYYGWAKVSYEALGFLFATGKQNDGVRLENVQLRIGAPRDNDLDSIEAGDITRMRRALGAWISVRDEVQLFSTSITTPDIRDENGVPFQIFYGISANSTRFWDISNAKRVIGYEPEDDALVEFRDHVARITEGA